MAGTNEPEQEMWMSYRHFLADCRCAKCGVEPKSKRYGGTWEGPIGDVEQCSVEEFDKQFGIAITKQLKDLGWRRINEYYCTLLCPKCAANS